MDVETFIARWSGLTGGAERANYAMFLCELCTALDLPKPDPASARHETNDYVFERMVRPHDSETGARPMRIDLYRRDAFVLEAKQSKAIPDCHLSPREAGEPAILGRRGTGAGWDALMANARRQAEWYVDHLPPTHRAPPFVVICDVGHVFEVYADFSGTGRDYTHFPDRQGFRIYLEELRDPAKRERLRRIWLDPWALDPASRQAEASREIAGRLATVGRRLEAAGYKAKPVAQFLMRCIFTMYACNMDLLPRGGFTRLLTGCRDNGAFVSMVGELWRRMRDPKYQGRFFSGFGQHLRYFGGRLFQHAEVLNIDPASLEILIEASQCDWSKVEPAIFGTFMEQAMDEDERRAGGVHYTPRHHVERLVQATILSPLRVRWKDVLLSVERAVADGRPQEAIRLILGFHQDLCGLRVLDPACGTGNFLYITLDLMKRLEGEVLEAMAQLGSTEQVGIRTIDPSNFLGLEINPRAAVIADLVLLLGYLQLHYRTRSGHPAEPILRDFGGVRHMDAILDIGAATYLPTTEANAAREAYPHASRPDWPEADYIVGNPPFLGGKDLRKRLGDSYAEALWATHPQMNPSADLVMYWWDQAAVILTRPGSRLKRFGFVTTNSITQAHQRRTVERWLTAERPLHLAWAIPDSPWTRTDKGGAAVRVAMTVAQAGTGEGERVEVIGEAGLDGDAPRLDFRTRRGTINADLSVGADLTRVAPLLANRGLCSPGVKLHGAGFIVTPDKARELGLGRRPGLEDYIRPYCNGRDLMQHARDVLVLDLYPLAADAVRARFPEVYQHLLARVKPERDTTRMAFRREHWWWFGATHEMYRSFTADLSRYIATPETAKHRVFAFVEAGVRADNMVLAIGSDDAFHLGVLSSRIHRAWALATGAVLEDRPRYTKTACFDPFPFPDPPPGLREEITTTAETLEQTRKAVLAEHADLTLTGLYNAVAAVERGAAPGRERALILSELHRRLDVLVAAAYGWSSELDDAEVAARLAALNKSRREEERGGCVLWLRPAYQTERFGSREEAQQSRLALVSSDPAGRSDRGAETRTRKPLFPGARLEQPLAVLACVTQVGAPLAAEEIVERFRGAGRYRKAIVENLHTLTLYGYIEALPGGRYLARRAA